MDEIEKMCIRTARLEQNLRDISSAPLEQQKLELERMLVRFEEEIVERVEAEEMNSKSRMRKMLIGAVVGCVLVIGWSKIM